MADDHAAVYEALSEAVASARPAALATVIATRGSMPRGPGSKMLVYEDGAIVGTVGGGAMEAAVIQEAIHAIASGQTAIREYTLNDPASGDAGVCGGNGTVFIEPVAIPPTLLVIGAGHVGKALAELGLWAGYRVIVSDDREDLCTPENIPGMAGYVVCAPTEIASAVPIHRHTYVASVTRGLVVDVDLIPALLATDAAYIGLIGSKRRWQVTRKALLESGELDEAALDRVASPIGLEIHAQTPKEIAVSILAEIVMTRRGGDGAPMRLAQPAGSIGAARTSG
jgi:xanthine dehydrogenase accessory factor